MQRVIQTASGVVVFGDDYTVTIPTNGKLTFEGDHTQWTAFVISDSKISPFFIVTIDRVE
jgi:hypothetical protein